MEAQRLIALLLAPFMPGTSEAMLEILGCDPAKSQLVGQDSWGALPPGSMIAKAQPLFPRIEGE